MIAVPPDIIRETRAAIIIGPDSEPLPTRDQLAARSGVSISTVARWARDGQVEYDRGRPGPGPVSQSEAGVPASRLISAGEAAKILHVDPKTVGKWAAAGKLTLARTEGGHRRFREDEALALAAQMASDPLLLPGQVAAILRVSPGTVSRWEKSGKLTCVRNARGWRLFRESDVRALLGTEAG